MTVRIRSTGFRRRKELVVVALSASATASVRIWRYESRR